MQFATRVLWFGSRSSLRVLKLVVPTRGSPFGWASGGARPGAAQWASGGARQEACASLGLGRARGNGRYKTSDVWHVGVEFVHPRFKTKTSLISLTSWALREEGNLNVNSREIIELSCLSTCTGSTARTGGASRRVAASDY